MNSAVRRVLIVKLSSLGDVVHAMPAVQDVRRTQPGVQMDWVVERAFAPLVSRVEGIARVIACDLRRWRKRPLAEQTRREWGAFRAELQSQRYDAVIDLQGLTKSALVSWLAHTTPQGQRIGMANQTEGSGFEAPARWVADRAIRLETHVHAVDRARLVCSRAMNYAMPQSLEFGLQAGSLAVPRSTPVADRAQTPCKPVVALVHGTSRADKEWPLAHWIELGQRLNHQGFAVALAHGNAAERATSQAIAAQLADAWVWPDMALDALTDTMATCAGVVGVDSGLSHIAVALGLPHVQIYNFDTAWRTGPQRDANQRSVYAPGGPDVDAVWQAWRRLDVPPWTR